MSNAVGLNRHRAALLPLRHLPCFTLSPFDSCRYFGYSVKCGWCGKGFNCGRVFHFHPNLLGGGHCWALPQAGGYLVQTRGISKIGNRREEEEMRRIPHYPNDEKFPEGSLHLLLSDNPASSPVKESGANSLLIAAYRHRLESFRFTSLNDLVCAPYAPSPLNIIEDILLIWRDINEALRIEVEKNKKRCSIHHSKEFHGFDVGKGEEYGRYGYDNNSMTLTSSLSTSRSCNKKNGSKGVAEEESSSVLSVLLSRRAHCQRVLSSSEDVKFCLGRVIREAQEVHEAVVIMGGGEMMSKRALQTITREVSRFVDIVKDMDVLYDPLPLSFSYSAFASSLSSPPSSSNEIEWGCHEVVFSVALPVPVHLVLQRSILRMSAALGLHVLAVEALLRMESLQEEVIRHGMRREQHREVEKALRKSASMSKIEKNAMKYLESAHVRRGDETEILSQAQDNEENITDDKDICFDRVVSIVEEMKLEDEAKRNTAQQNVLNASFSSLIESTTKASNASAWDAPPCFISLVSPDDYLLGIQSCSAAKEFDLALTLLHRLIDHIHKEEKKKVNGTATLTQRKGASEKEWEREEVEGWRVEEFSPLNEKTSTSSSSIVSASSPFPISSERKLDLIKVEPTSEVVHILHHAFTALAKAVRNHEDFHILRSLLVENNVVAPFTPAVSSFVEFYTAMIEAVSRSVPSAVEQAKWNALSLCRQPGSSLSSTEGGGGGFFSLSVRQEELISMEVSAVYAKYLSIALSFYRQLRDTGLVPRAETYAGLIGCSAVCREPTQAFAFYHEARCVTSGGRRPGMEGNGGGGSGEKSYSIPSNDQIQPDARNPRHNHKSSMEPTPNALTLTTNQGNSHNAAGGVSEGVQDFPPSLYTNLLLAYHYAGYHIDAKKTLEVLVEAGAPLERASFHAVLAGCVSLREGQEVFDMMVSQYRLSPTPHTFAFLVQALIPHSHRSSSASRLGTTHVPHSQSSYGGVEAVLQLYDLHELALRSLGEEVESQHSLQVDKSLSEGEEDDKGRMSAGGVSSSSSSRGGVASQGINLEKLLVERYPPYVSAVVQVLLHLRLDPHMDPRLNTYLKPLIRIAQLWMNQYTGCTPQCPTHIPTLPVHASSTCMSSSPPPLCVAVLAADVLANLEEYVVPFLSHYSILVLPFSAVMALRQSTPMASSRHTNKTCSMGKESAGEAILLSSLTEGMKTSIRSSSPSSILNEREKHGVYAQRQHKLQQFIQKYRSSIHLMSLEEELCWSRDTHRYHIPRRDWLANAAAITLNLARTDVEGGTKLYAAHPVPPPPPQLLPSSLSSSSTSPGVGPVGQTSWEDSFSALIHSAGALKCPLTGKFYSNTNPHHVTSNKSAAFPSPSSSSSCSVASGVSPLLVLVSTQFNRCGRYLVDFKAQVLREVQDFEKREKRKRYWQDAREKATESPQNDTFPFTVEPADFSVAMPSSFPSLALQAAVSRVFYHNPYTTPLWSPPLLSASSSSEYAESAGMSPLSHMNAEGGEKEEEIFREKRKFRSSMVEESSVSKSSSTAFKTPPTQRIDCCSIPPLYSSFPPPLKKKESSRKMVSLPGEGEHASKHLSERIRELESQIARRRMVRPSSASSRSRVFF